MLMRTYQTAADCCKSTEHTLKRKMLVPLTSKNVRIKTSWMWPSSETEVLFLKNQCWLYIRKAQKGNVKRGKAIPLQAWTGPEGSRRLGLPRFQDNRYMNMVGFSALRTGRLYPPRKYSWHSFLLETVSTTPGNRTRDLPACSAVPQATVLPRARTKNYGM
jgi:hypothetical protein